MEIRLPDIGDFENIPVIEIHVSPGDVVAVEDPLLTLESDKATMDIPSPSAGTVGEIRVAIGDLVSQGTVIMELTEQGSGAASAGARPGRAGLGIGAERHPSRVSRWAMARRPGTTPRWRSPSRTSGTTTTSR